MGTVKGIVGTPILINNTNILLSWQGMHFLQNSTIGVHGNLKSSNVVIDSRWTCKVTDHGLFLFKEGQEIDVEAGSEAKYFGSCTFPKINLLF